MSETLHLIDIPNGQTKFARENGAEKDANGNYFVTDKTLQNNPLFENYLQSKRLYLNTTPDDLPFLKSKGARFDGKQKKWFAPAFVNQKNFQHLAGIREYDINAAMADFKDFAQQKFGATIKEIIPDGKFHHVTADDDKHGKQSITYAFHTNDKNYPPTPPVGLLNNYKTGQKLKWVAQSSHINQDAQISIADLQKRQQELAEKRHQQEIQEAQKHDERAGQISAYILDENKQFQKNLYSAQVQEFPYLVEKHIIPNKFTKNDPDPRLLPPNEHFVSVIDKTIKYADKFTGEPRTFINPNLVIPLINIKGEIRSVQTIYQARNKETKQNQTYKILAENAEKTGNFHVVGGKFDQIKDNSTIVLSEGYATACSVQAILNFVNRDNNEKAFAVSAVDSGNIPAVAKNFREKFQNANIIIACDFDAAGIKAGQQCAEIKDGNFLILNPPEQENIQVFEQYWHKQKNITDKKITDYNDLNSTSIEAFAFAVNHFKSFIQQHIKKNDETILNQPLTETIMENQNINTNESNDLPLNLVKEFTDFFKECEINRNYDPNSFLPEGYKEVGYSIYDFLSYDEVNLPDSYDAGNKLVEKLVTKLDKIPNIKNDKKDTARKIVSLAYSLEYTPIDRVLNPTERNLEWLNKNNNITEKTKKSFIENISAFEKSLYNITNKDEITNNLNNAMKKTINEIYSLPSINLKKELESFYNDNTIQNNNFLKNLIEKTNNNIEKYTKSMYSAYTRDDGFVFMEKIIRNKYDELNTQKSLLCDLIKEIKIPDAKTFNNEWTENQKKEFLEKCDTFEKEIYKKLKNDEILTGIKPVNYQTEIHNQPLTETTMENQAFTPENAEQQELAEMGFGVGDYNPDDFMQPAEQDIFEQEPPYDESYEWNSIQPEPESFENIPEYSQQPQAPTTQTTQQTPPKQTNKTNREFKKETPAMAEFKDYIQQEFGAGMKYVIADGKFHPVTVENNNGEKETLKYAFHANADTGKPAAAVIYKDGEQYKWKEQGQKQNQKTEQPAQTPEQSAQPLKQPTQTAEQPAQTQPEGIIVEPTPEAMEILLQEILSNLENPQFVPQNINLHDENDINVKLEFSTLERKASQIKQDTAPEIMEKFGDNFINLQKNLLEKTTREWQNSVDSPENKENFLNGINAVRKDIDNFQELIVPQYTKLTQTMSETQNIVSENQFADFAIKNYANEMLRFANDKLENSIKQFSNGNIDDFAKNMQKINGDMKDLQTNLQSKIASKQEKFVDSAIDETLNQENIANFDKELSNDPEKLFTKEQLEQYKNSDVLVIDLDDILSQTNEQGGKDIDKILKGLESERINPAYMQTKNVFSNVFNGINNFLHKIIDKTFGKLAGAPEYIPAEPQQRAIAPAQPNQIQSAPQQQQAQNVQPSAAVVRETIKQDATSKLQKADKFLNASFNKAEEIIKKIREHFPDKAIIITCAENTKENIKKISKSCQENGMILAQKGTQAFKTLVEKPVEAYKNAKSTLEANKATKQARAEINQEIAARLEKMEKMQQSMQKDIGDIKNEIKKGRSH